MTTATAPPTVNLPALAAAVRDHWGTTAKPAEVCLRFGTLREVLGLAGVGPLPERNAALGLLVNRALRTVPAAVTNPPQPSGNGHAKPAWTPTPNSIPALVLAAAQACALASPRGDFSLEFLMAECVERWPERFALARYPTVADVRKVSVAVSGEKGLVGRGLLRREGRLYRVVEGRTDTR